MKKDKNLLYLINYIDEIENKVTEQINRCLSAKIQDEIEISDSINYLIEKSVRLKRLVLRAYGSYDKTTDTEYQYEQFIQSL